MQLKNLLYYVICLLLLFACSSNYDKNGEMTIDLLYAQGLESVSKGNLKTAQITFEKISNRYPFTKEAMEANIFLIWIYYVNHDVINLEVTAEAFLKYYVDNKYTPWVVYMNALAKYENIAPVNKDQTYTHDALLAFQNIINENTIDEKYIKDAKYRLQIVKYILAQKDNEVAFYYLKNKNYIAALKRYQNITNLYQETEFVEEALFRQVYIWIFLGVHQEAFKILSTLGYNYPSSKWYKMGVSFFTQYAPDYDVTQVIKPNIMHDQ